MIYLGADHAGYALKEKLRQFLDKKGIAYSDESPILDEKDDYPDPAQNVGKKVVKNKAAGVLICGTGMGICMAANKVKGVRAADVYSTETAKLAKAHNHANIICFGGRTMKPKDIEKYFAAWYQTSLDSDPRHLRRINKMEKTRWI